jgi:gamma-glutamylputrescine oxidase
LRNFGHPEGSWYRDTANSQAVWPVLTETIRAEVCVIGAGFTGLGAALELARTGIEVVCLESARVGSGGSGRNGGQIHPGQRRDQAWLEARLGLGTARNLWTVAEHARNDLKALIQEFKIDCDLTPGLIHANHRPGGADQDRIYVEHLSRQFGYELCELLSREALEAQTGSQAYYGGLIDHGGGHVHPLNLALGLARGATELGARIFETSHVTGWKRVKGGFEVSTATGRVLCSQLILTGDGYVDGLSGHVEARVMPINNFIAVTAPLDIPEILPDRAAVADSRFVVNYFRRTADDRLLFGGGENYTPWFPSDIASFVRPHIEQVYPQLKSIEISHAWGGTLGVTWNRVPLVGEIEPAVWIAAGYSGQGVMLAPYMGKLMARACLGNREELDAMARLPVPPFPGGKFLRWPIMVAGMSWFALRDRFG